MPSIAVKVAKVESCVRQVLRIAQWGHYDGSWNLMHTNKTPGHLEESGMWIRAKSSSNDKAAKQNYISIERQD